MQVKNVIDFTQDFKQSNMESLEEILHEIISSRPFGDHKFYINSFMKDTEDVFVKRLIHHPRLTKPEPVPNSRLYRVDPNRPDEVTVMWILPNAEEMKLFKKGKVFEDELINDSIRMYHKDKGKLRQKEPDDLPDEEVRRIYASLRGPLASPSASYLRF